MNRSRTHSRILGAVAAGALALGVDVGPAAAAPSGTTIAAERIALVVGNNVGQDPRRSLRYAEGEVGRLAGLLERAGDFQSVQILRAQSRTDVEAALLTARRRLESAKRAGRETLFLFYYSGHADGEALELGPTRLPLRDLRNHLEQMPADVRLGFIDACQSGALTGVKGGRRAPGYEVRLADTANVKGLAIVTSSTASEFSQESDDLRSSYFSHNLMAGLQGLADTSGDGNITLSELYHFAYRRTLAGTAASPIGGQHPTYVYQISGTGDVVLTRTRARDARLRFAPEPGATYTVLDAGDVVAEVVPSNNEATYLALPAGNYRVVRRSLAHLSEHLVTLAAGDAPVVDARVFSPLSADEVRLARKKGTHVDGAAGDLRAARDEGRAAPVDRLSLDVGLEAGLPSADSPVTAISLGFMRHLDGPFAVRVRTALARFEVTTPGTFRNDFVRVLPAVDLLANVLPDGELSLHVGPTVGVPLVRQSTGITTRWSYGFQYGATGTLAWAFGATKSRSVGVTLTGGGELFKLDGQRTHAGFIAASVGAGFGF